MNQKDNRAPVNRCLGNLIRRNPSDPLAIYWLGGYVAYGYKYRILDKPEVFTAEDRALSSRGGGFPLIALDLDTTSLGPLVAHLTWLAMKETWEV
jgi:hypothetical protein